MKLPIHIYEKKEHGDGIAISRMYGVPKSSVSDVFQVGEGKTNTVRAIIDFYNVKYGRPEIYNLKKLI